MVWVVVVAVTAARMMAGAKIVTPGLGLSQHSTPIWPCVKLFSDPDLVWSQIMQDSGLGCLKVQTHCPRTPTFTQAGRDQVRPEGYHPDETVFRAIIM